MGLTELKYFIFLPLLLLVFLVKKPWSSWFRFFFLEICLALSAEALAFSLMRQGQPNHWVYNINLFFDFLILSTMIVHYSPPKRRNYTWVILCLIVLIVSYLIHLSIGRTLFEFSSMTLILGGFFLAAQAMWVLYREASSSTGTLIRQPIFWVLTAVLISSLCSSPLFALLHYYIEVDMEIARSLMGVNDFLFLMRYGLPIIGLALMIKKPALA